MLTATLGRTTARSHAAERWAHAVVRLIDSDRDVRSIDTWGRAVGISRGTLRTWCTAAGLPAKNSLDFARLLRSVMLSQGHRWDLFNTLDIIDARTLRRLVTRGGIAELRERRQTPDVWLFLATQRFVRDEAALNAIVSLLAAWGGEKRQSA